MMIERLRSVALPVKPFRISCGLAVFAFAVSAAATQPKLSPLGPNVPRELVQSNSQLRYNWQPGKSFVYKFSIEMQVGQEKLAYQGRNALVPTGNRPQLTSGEEEEKRSTASGFVVHPEGIIVTCAHAVRGAVNVMARIDDRNYKATVIGVDFDKDLAVLRVAAKGLPVLSFANSDRVRLADEVRAIGFPLTDILGESIKVTRGEISGIGGPRGEKTLQCDAPINPGNSGGPLVDTSGRVVGVASALLSGADISEVGFAIPANEAIDFVKSLHVPVSTIDQASPMHAADVVERASHSCVLIKTEHGPNGVGTGKLSELGYSAYWIETTVPS